MSEADEDIQKVMEKIDLLSNEMMLMSERLSSLQITVRQALGPITIHLDGTQGMMREDYRCTNSLDRIVVRRETKQQPS